MNKIDTQRYYLNDRQTSPSSPKYTLKTEEGPRHSHALSRLVQKQTQIQTVKKRISALCLRQQKYTHRTLNTQMQLQKKQAIRKESQRIQHLLARQRQKQSQHLQILKYKSIQARAGNYFRLRTVKQKKDEIAHEMSAQIRNRSRQHDNLIREQKIAVIESKKQKSRDIKIQSLQTKQSRSRILKEKKLQVQSRELSEAQHFSRLEQIKNHQLKQLSQLQLTMLQKNLVSRAAYQTTRCRLQKETNCNSEGVARTSKASNPETAHLNFYY